MAISLSTSARNAHANGVVDLLNAGAGPGVLQILTGAKPASPQTAASGTLLATVVLGDPAAPAAVTGVKTFTNPAAVTPVAAGTAGWFRAQDSDGAAVFDGTCSDPAGSGDLKLGTVALTTGVSVDVESLTYTAPQEA